ncbi:hypothetical protein LJY25_02295 [Hymenobacter sp. BT175]|uniref:hypothetical protein n=1 Tax=Hymenobacter translucens TaxID=2886507 RepID=UPI001D0E5898|nr:hypothetical protein [Hymenobacter translucens]MCC2545260.1 hypothetical protein [Hymenobacter translucens]
MSRLCLFFPLFLLLTLMAGSGIAQPAAANKALFDTTVDELNFRTMETVYDKSFTRNKFPVSLRSHQARRQFDGFGSNTDLKKLFLNYNDVAERYKGRFGKGRTDLAEFEKQLRSILLDKNFEFFIRVLPRDERVALIRSLERIIKQATAQFNASEDPLPEDVAADGAAVPPADVDAEGPVTAPLEDPAPQADASTASTTTSGSLTSAPRPEATVSRYGWLDYLTFLLALGSFGLLLRLTLITLPEMRARLDDLSGPDNEADTAEPKARRSFSQLDEDRYDDDETN